MTSADPARVAGLLLAAGAGRRYGRPKALVVDDGVPWVLRTLTVMRDAGCAPILVVIGAAAAEVRNLLPPAAIAVQASDWETGLAASLRAGLTAAAELPDDVTSLLVMLVDLPGVTAAMLARMRSLGRSTALAQARFGADPGHPVLLGRDHWAGVAAVAVGDSGARPYLSAHRVTELVLGSAAEGADVDTPAPEPSSGADH